MVIKIKVTEEHIDKGNQADCYSCPIALALKEASQELGTPEVCGYMVYWPKKIGTLPHKAREFIRKFDKDRTAQPFEFEIDIEDFSNVK